MGEAEVKRVFDARQLRQTIPILLGAAHADGQYAGEEIGAIRSLLTEQVGEAYLPRELIDEMWSFDDATFELEAACAELELETSEQRRELLRLVACVMKADRVYQIPEDAFLYRVAQIIGALDEYESLSEELDELLGWEPDESGRVF